MWPCRANENIIQNKTIWSPCAFPPPLHRHSTTMPTLQNDSSRRSGLQHGCCCFPHPKTEILSHSGMSALPPPTTHSTFVLWFYYLPLFFIHNNRTHARHFYFLGNFPTQAPALSCETQAYCRTVAWIAFGAFAIDFIVCALNCLEFVIGTRASVSIGIWTFSSMHDELIDTSKYHTFSKSSESLLDSINWNQCERF